MSLSLFQNPVDLLALFSPFQSVDVALPFDQLSVFFLPSICLHDSLSIPNYPYPPPLPYKPVFFISSRYSPSPTLALFSALCDDKYPFSSATYALCVCLLARTKSSTRTHRHSNTHLNAHAHTHTQRTLMNNSFSSDLGDLSLVRETGKKRENVCVLN